MVIGKKLWQTMAFIVIAAMLVGSIPALTVSAQSEAIVSSKVSGELNEQFAKHYLELRVTDPSRAVRLVMDYNPQDRQELDSGAGFYVFDESGFRNLVNTGSTESNLATGALENSTGTKQKVAVIADPVGSFSVVPFNDSKAPFDYTLTVENAVLVDGSGDQVTNELAPAGVAVTTEADTTEEESATATATVTETAAVTTTAAVTATATATPEAAMAATPSVIKVDELEGELNERFAKHYYELETTDVTRPVVIEMAYDPQDSQALDNGFNFFVFDESQFRALTTAPSSGTNTAAGELTTGTPKMKRAVINQPFRTYTVIVANDSDTAAHYTLMVDNAVLVDGSAQSITAQEMGATTGLTTTTATTGTTTTTTTTTVTTTAAAATPAQDAITPPTTYTVVAGDTLGTIARRAYGNIQLYQQLCTFNSIADCNRIEIGDKIEIPLQAGLGSVAPAAAATATPTPTAAAAAATPAATATATPAEEPATAGSTTNAEASGDLVATTGTFSVLDTLGLLLDLLELETDQSNNIKAILQSGEYTFFAPTDTAFTSLDEATLEELIANPSELATVLKGHIVPNQALTSDLTNGMQLETLAGTTLTVNISGSTVTVGDATVVQADVPATNGVIHIINSVLLPTP